MLPKVEVESIIHLEASMNNKKEEQNDKDYFGMDKESICTVDKEAVEDHGSSEEEEDNLPARWELCQKSPDDAPGDNLIGVGGSKVDIDDYNNDDSPDAYILLPDDDDDSFEPNASPPEAKKCNI